MNKSIKSARSSLLTLANFVAMAAAGAGALWALTHGAGGLGLVLGLVAYVLGVVEGCREKPYIKPVPTPEEVAWKEANAEAIAADPFLSMYYRDVD